MTTKEIADKLDFITNRFIRGPQKTLSHLIHPGKRMELYSIYESVEEGYYKLNELISELRKD